MDRGDVAMENAPSVNMSPIATVEGVVNKNRTSVTSKYSHPEYLAQNAVIMKYWLTPSNINPAWEVPIQLSI